MTDTEQTKMAGTENQNGTLPDAPSSESKDVEMSRGERPKATIDFNKLEALYVYDEYENKIRFCDVFRKQKTIIIFVRHFLDFITKEYVEDLAIIPLEYLQEVDVRLVVIGPAPVKFIKPFKKLTGYQYTMYCDPEREVYKALGMHEKLEGGNLEESKHIKSGAMMGVLSSMWRAMRYQEYQGNPRQQGASFIMGPGEVVHFEHLDETCTDHMNINDLLIKAGVQPVSFPKDQRVVTI
ncbi:peroxiredoxin-like 2C [Babylonia areolata]|uniref:peroxiredoxin-like 2C n=1 Tax=Babylonia areolata TaxID=304850 RepID=UPI003FCEFEA2